MTNSAHDDISIVGDYLSESFAHDQDLQKIYKLIHEMQKCESMGDAQILQQKIRLQQVDDEDTIVEFDVNSVASQGWLNGFIGSFFADQFSEQLSEEDLQAIANNDFTMQMSLHDENPAIELDALIDKMDTYEIGRPSTIASTIEKMLADRSLLTSSQGAISLTKDGKLVLQELRKHFGDIANMGWNLKFASELMDISDGSLPPEECLFAVFESLYGTDEKEKVRPLGWTDPDVLHEEIDDANNVKIGGVISIGDSFGGW